MVLLETLKRGLWLVTLRRPPGRSRSTVSGTLLPGQAKFSRPQFHPRRLNLPPLVWSDKVAAVAQQWRRFSWSGTNSSIARNRSLAKTCSRSTEPARRRSGRERMGVGGRNYDYGSNRCTGVCGHYTQIVWRGTHELGCGLAPGPSREVWVCDYAPPAM